MHRDVSHAGDDVHGKSPAVWTVGALALLLILPIGSRRPRQRLPRKLSWCRSMERASISHPQISPTQVQFPLLTPGSRIRPARKVMLEQKMPRLGGCRRPRRMSFHRVFAGQSAFGISSAVNADLDSGVLAYWGEVTALVLVLALR